MLNRPNRCSSTVYSPAKRRVLGGGVRSIKIEDLPDELYERLIASAARHQRTLQREIIACLDSELPALSAWYARVKERPGFKRWLDLPLA